MGDTNRSQWAATCLAPSPPARMGDLVLVYRERLCPLAGLIPRETELQIPRSLFWRGLPPCCIISGLPQQTDSVLRSLPRGEKGVCLAPTGPLAPTGCCCPNTSDLLVKFRDIGPICDQRDNGPSLVSA